MTDGMRTPASARPPRHQRSTPASHSQVGLGGSGSLEEERTPCGRLFARNSSARIRMFCVHQTRNTSVPLRPLALVRLCKLFEIVMRTYVHMKIMRFSQQDSKRYVFSIDTLQQA